MLGNLTPLEKRIIEFLAQNPRQNTQQIQRGLGKEDKNYPTVKKALERLQKKKRYAKFRMGKSEKQVSIRKYELIALGVSVFLAFGDDKILGEVFVNYPQFDTFHKVITLLSPLTAKKLMRLIGKMSLEYGVEGWKHQNLMALLIASGPDGLIYFSEAEVNEIKNAAMKVKDSRQAMQDTLTKINRTFTMENNEV